jgi:hypothetical protein
VDADQVLAFRLARSGLAARTPGGPAGAAAPPLSDFARDAALVALAARAEEVTREAYEAAIADGGLVLAHAPHGAIHALAPGDDAVFGRALLARDDAELGAQMGRQVQRVCAEHGIAAGDALAEVADAVRGALAGGAARDRDGLHAALRERVRPELMPWCRGCGSHHVMPMLWRYATVAAAARLDSARRYGLGRPGRTPAARGAVRRFLGWYGPSTPAAFGEWAGLARPHARRLWDEVADELAEVEVGRTRGWLLRDDLAALGSPPASAGVRLLPPGDPFLQPANRALLVPDAGTRKAVFRPVASPGAVISRGRLVGLWRMRLQGGRADVAVERLGRLPAREVAAEARRVAGVRGAARADVGVS